MKKNFLLLSIILILIFALSCGSKTENEKTADGKNIVTLEFMMWGAPDELDTVKGYLRQFHKDNPGIKIKIIHKNEYDQALMTYFAGGSPPDVMYMGSEAFPNYADKGQLLALDSFIKRDNFSMKDFYPQLPPNFMWKNKTYGIPKDFTPLVLYYNKDIFVQAGVEAPKSDWTWKDFLSACKKLTKDFNDDGMIDQYGYVVESWFGEWYPWVIQNGGKIISDDNKKWLLGDPKYLDKNAEALQFLADLMHKYKVAPASNVTRDKEPSVIFKTGKAAMCTYGRWMCMQFKDIKSFDWDVQVLPKEADRASTLFTVCYAIAAKTKHPEESWKLIKFLTGEVGQKATARSGHAIPSMESIANSDDFLKAPAIPQKINAKVFLDSIKYSNPTPTNVKWSRIQEILGRELQYVWEGKKTAKVSILAVQNEIQKILDDKD